MNTEYCRRNRGVEFPVAPYPLCQSLPLQIPDLLFRMVFLMSTPSGKPEERYTKAFSWMHFPFPHSLYTRNAPRVNGVYKEHVKKKVPLMLVEYGELCPLGGLLVLLLRVHLNVIIIRPRYRIKFGF